jgi:PST family polysaccharide transporter
VKKNWRKLFSGAESRKLLSNFMSLSSLRGLEMLLPLITLPYLVRVLGLENYGLLAFAISMATYSTAFIQYGFNITAVRELARAGDDDEQVSRIVSLALTITLSLAVAAFIIFAAVTFFVARFTLDLELYLLSFLFIASQALFPVWFFQGIAEMKYVAILNVLSKICAVCGILLFVNSQHQYALVPLINFICSLFSFILALRLIYKRFNVRYKLPEKSAIWGALRIGSAAFITQAAPALYNNSSTFLLGLFTSPTVVGIYTAATRVVEVFATLATILSSTFLPYLARKPKLMPKFNKMMLLIGVLLSITCILLSDICATLLFSAENLVVATYIKYLAPGITALFAVYAFGTNSLMLMGHDKLVRNGALYVSIVFFIIALCLVPLLGIYGSCITIVGARVSMALYYGFFYKKYADNGGKLEASV